MPAYEPILDTVGDALFATAPWRLRAAYEGAYCNARGSVLPDQDLEFLADGSPDESTWDTLIAAGDAIIDDLYDHGENENHLSQGTSSRKPELATGGDLHRSGSTVNFPAPLYYAGGFNRYLTKLLTTAADDMTFVFGINRTVGVSEGENYLLSWSNVDYLGIRFNNPEGTQIEFIDGTETVEIEANGGAEYTGFAVFAVRLDLSEGTCEIYKNGTLLGSGSYSNKGGDNTLQLGGLGAAANFGGYIESMIIYERKLDDTDLGFVMSKLADPTVEAAGSRSRSRARLSRFNRHRRSRVYFG